jgi:large subunit ribosomal protein L15
LKQKNINKMNLNNLQPAEGSTKTSKRIGRGQGSGRGGTSTRGHKGQKSRSGYSRKIGFEGGQMPLQRVVPKMGFKNINRVEFKAINLDVLEAVATKNNLTAIDKDSLVQAGIASKNDKIKILGGGTLTKKLEVKANAFSKSAKEAIEKLEGTTEIL